LVPSSIIISKELVLEKLGTCPERFWFPDKSRTRRVFDTKVLRGNQPWRFVSARFSTT
jgi:hypothetical protein